MPGGDREVYEKAAPILTKIALKSEMTRAVSISGQKGRALYKMVHNGIEYADMRLIAEAYTFLRETRVCRSMKLHLFLKHGIKVS